MISFFTHYVFPVIDILVFIFSITLVICYMIMGVLSTYAVFKYKYQNRSSDYNTILFTEELEPSISLIATSYNEALTIVDCMRALLDLRYSNYEVIVVNDGSTDDSLDLITQEYDLQKVDYYLNPSIKTKPVRGIYKSTNKAYHNILVVDKENGGKADALNAGINISTKLYIVCVDVDGILTADSLQKLVKPILESKGKAVIAVGGVIHVANGCQIDGGVLVDKKIPKGNNVRMQVIEYLRAFLVGRMAFGQFNGLLIVSGGIGIFRKDYIKEIGGYNPESLGEDMELVLRMRKYFYEKKIDHAVKNIPEPLLWTEVPPNLKIMGRQRTRWARGLIDTLKRHRRVMLNPKYGLLGMITFPFFFVFEFLAPFIEVLGMFYIVFLIVMQIIQWRIYVFLFLFMYLFGVGFSFLGILLGQLTYPVYNRKKDLFRLFLTSLTEAFAYHPRIVFWALKGYWMYFRGVKSWGVMTRKGFK